jgi:hypothetical protein
MAMRTSAFIILCDVVLLVCMRILHEELKQLKLAWRSYASAVDHLPRYRSIFTVRTPYFICARGWNGCIVGKGVCKMVARSVSGIFTYLICSL